MLLKGERRGKVKNRKFEEEGMEMNGWGGGSRLEGGREGGEGLNWRLEEAWEVEGRGGGHCRYPI